jgi:hypothetical protein
MKKLLKNYWAPTPKKWCKLGDALLTVSTTITGFSIAMDHKTLAYTALICGILGKVITNLFTKTEQTENI